MDAINSTPLRRTSVDVGESKGLNTSLHDINPRRKVHFTPTECSHENHGKGASSFFAETKVDSTISWMDQNGIIGRYTGQVNDYNQPHGPGLLVYDDGTVQRCIWRDGMYIRHWIPKDQKSRHQALPSSSKNCKMVSGAKKIISNRTYLRHLDIGDVVKRVDMVREGSDQLEIGSLQIHDFAFILRSDGQWTYAIIADRNEDVIRFVADTRGSHKALTRRNWATHIRLVNVNKKNSATAESELNELPVDDEEVLPPPPFWVTSSTTTTTAFDDSDDVLSLF
mmetsp:Transcript_32726/g.60340  ORF Transcript_32726/g.60340 Transcript_32726/m.60340 type:complete len:281 (-) Transcript_32726:181-1023(-)